MSEHTKEPWAQHEDDPRAIVAVSEPHLSLLTVGDDRMVLVYNDADARRIVACVNALAGVSTEHLEQYGLPDFAQKISDLAQQRDKLLAALEKCRDMVGHPDNVDFINAAIAEVKGQS